MDQPFKESGNKAQRNLTDADKEFLLRVVAWPMDGEQGCITIHWQHPKKKGFYGRSCQTIDDALRVVAELQAGPPANIYFCLSRQRLNNGSRSGDNALAFRCVWVDVDVDPENEKKYSSLAEAVAAVLRFCLKVGLPPPSFMVASGTGLHAYWLSDCTLSVEEWQPFADALKAAAQNAGLKFDAGVTSDAARVLRVPGTVNWKNKPRPVKLLQTYCNGTAHDFAVVFEKISGGRATPPAKLKVAEAFKGLDPNESLAAGIELPEFPPLPFAPIREGCAWLREAHDTGGKGHDQPQWHLTILSATFIENGHELAHQLGNQHPDYTPEETEEKWDEKIRARETKDIGWPSCKTIEDAGSKHCQMCRYRDAGKSPLNIGFEAVTAEAVDQELQKLGGTRPPGARLPEGFCFDEKGQLCAFIPAKVTGQKRHPSRLLPLISNRIDAPSLQFQNGHYGFGFTASTDRGGTGEVFLTVDPVLHKTWLAQAAGRQSRDVQSRARKVSPWSRNWPSAG